MPHSRWRTTGTRGSAPRETSAIGSLTAINQAQFAFTQTCGNQKFAPSLPSLGKPNPGTDRRVSESRSDGADEVDKSGYRIAMDGTEVAERWPLTCTGETPLERVSRHRRSGDAGRDGQPVLRH